MAKALTIVTTGFVGRVTRQCFLNDMNDQLTH